MDIWHGFCFGFKQAIKALWALNAPQSCASKLYFEEPMAAAAAPMEVKKEESSGKRGALISKLLMNTDEGESWNEGMEKWSEYKGKITNELNATRAKRVENEISMMVDKRNNWATLMMGKMAEVDKANEELGAKMKEEIGKHARRMKELMERKEDEVQKNNGNSH